MAQGVCVSAPAPVVFLGQRILRSFFTRLVYELQLKTK